MTFEYVEVAPKENYQRTVVIGTYDDETTHLECDTDRVRIGGLRLDTAFDSIQLRPADGEDVVWVDATDEQLRVTAERPSDE